MSATQGLPVKKTDEDISKPIYLTMTKQNINFSQSYLYVSLIEKSKSWAVIQNQPIKRDLTHMKMHR